VAKYARVVNLNSAKATAGPSTQFAAQNAANFAQDDNFVVVRTSELPDWNWLRWAVFGELKSGSLRDDKR
jgi:hypothetical protein